MRTRVNQSINRTIRENSSLCNASIATRAHDDDDDDDARVWVPVVEREKTSMVDEFEMRDLRREMFDARRGVPPTARARDRRGDVARRHASVDTISTRNFSQVTQSRRKAIKIYALRYNARCNAITRHTRLWFSGKIFVSHIARPCETTRGTNESPGFDSRWAHGIIHAPFLRVGDSRSYFTFLKRIICLFIFLYSNSNIFTMRPFAPATFYGPFFVVPEGDA